MNNGPALSVCAGPYILYSRPWLAPVDLLVHKAENCLQSWNGYFSIHISEISGPSFNQKSNSMSQDDGHWVPSSFPFSLQESLCLCCISLGFCNSDNKNRLKTWTCTRLLASKKIRLHLRNCTSAQTSDLIFFGSPLAIHLFFSSSHVLDHDESSELFALWGPNGTKGTWQNWRKGTPVTLLLAGLWRRHLDSRFFHDTCYPSVFMIHLLFFLKTCSVGKEKRNTIKFLKIKMQMTS